MDRTSFLCLIRASGPEVQWDADGQTDGVARLWRARRRPRRPLVWRRCTAARRDDWVAGARRERGGVVDRVTLDALKPPAAGRRAAAVSRCAGGHPESWIGARISRGALDLGLSIACSPSWTCSRAPCRAAALRRCEREARGRLLRLLPLFLETAAAPPPSTCDVSR